MTAPIRDTAHAVGETDGCDHKRVSWGDVWVSDAKVRPEIDEDLPQAPWLLAGIVTSEERAFVEAVQSLSGTRSAHARAVDFYLQVQTPTVVLNRKGAPGGAVAFEPEGLWVAVDLTVDGGSPRFVAFKQRVRTASMSRPLPGVPAGHGTPRAVLPLRAHAPSRSNALEWAYRR